MFDRRNDGFGRLARSFAPAWGQAVAMKALFGSDPAPLPPPTPVAAMPDPNDPALLAAKRRTMLEAQTRSGRASTVLSGDYSSDKLGVK